MTHDEKLKLLEDFCRFLEKAGYLDSDWYSEEPTAIDRYLEEDEYESENMK